MSNVGIYNLLLLHRKSPHLGTAAVEFLFNTNIRETTTKNNGQSKFLSHPFLQALVSWKETGTSHPTFLSQKTVVQKECWRLSECAIAYLIVNAPLLDTPTISELVQCYIQHYNVVLAEGSNNSASKIFNNILVHVHQLSSGGNEVARIICENIEPGISVTLSDPFLNALIKSIQQVK